MKRRIVNRGSGFIILGINFDYVVREMPEALLFVDNSWFFLFKMKLFDPIFGMKD